MIEKKNLKRYIKFILKKSYRKELYDQLDDVSIKDISRVKDAKKTVLILQRSNTKVGVFSDFIVFLKSIEFAIEKNYVPIVDRKTITNDFLPADGKVNTWELFFEQPCGIGLDDIDISNYNVKLCNNGAGLYPVSLLHCDAAETVAYWRAFAKKYIKFNTQMKAHLHQKYDDILRGKRVIGVSIREGYQKLFDMNSGILYGHPIQASKEKILEDVIKYMDAWGCEYVFVTCQTTETVDYFREKLQEKALFYDRKRSSYGDLYEGDDVKKNRTYETAVVNEKDYITEIYLLSKCTCLICSENSGSEAANIMSDGYENMLCYNEGVYFSET